MSGLLTNFLFLVPLKQTRDVRRRAKEKRHLSQPATTELGSCFFSAKTSVSFLRARLDWGAIPPVVVNTRGVKSPCSTWRILALYSRIFDFSAWAKTRA